MAVRGKRSPGKPTSDTTRLRVFNLGVLGVNIVETPLHVQDGELETGQNAELYLDSGELALRKRPGFDSFGSLDGAPTALCSVPLPDPFFEATELYLCKGGEGYAAYDPGLGAWTWHAGEEPSTTGSAGDPWGRQSMANAAGVVYLDDGVSPYQLKRFDGNTVVSLFTFPGIFYSSGGLWLDGGDLYVTAFLAGGGGGTVYKNGVDISAASFPSRMPFAPCVVGGTLYVVSGDNTAKSWQLHQYTGGTSWTTVGSPVATVSAAIGQEHYAQSGKFMVCLTNGLLSGPPLTLVSADTCYSIDGDGSTFWVALSGGTLFQSDGTTLTFERNSPTFSPGFVRCLRGKVYYGAFTTGLERRTSGVWDTVAVPESRIGYLMVR